MTSSSKRRTASRAAVPSSAPSIGAATIALVAREYNQPDWRSKGKAEPRSYGFGSFLREVLRGLKGHRPDLIVFAPFSFAAAGKPTHAQLFPGTSLHGVVVLETRDFGSAVTEIHLRDVPKPILLEQHFAHSTQSADQKVFMKGLPSRKVGHSLMLLCGESNIVRTIRRSDEIRDKHGFLDWLRNNEIDLIINPIHSYMKRWEMPLKRLALSKDGALVVSLWNRGLMGVGESRKPWAAYRAGKEVSELITTVHEARDRRDYWIGLLKTR